MWPRGTAPGWGGSAQSPPSWVLVPALLPMRVCPRPDLFEHLAPIHKLGPVVPRQPATENHLRGEGGGGIVFYRARKNFHALF